MNILENESHLRGVMPDLESREWLRLADTAYFIDSANPFRGQLSSRQPGIFLAHAFTNEQTPGGIVGRTTRYKIELILNSLRASNFLAHCALEREDWGRKLMLPGDLTRVDFREIEKCNMLVVFPQDSQGACIEIGWAGAMGKIICICWDIDKPTTINLSGIQERLYALGRITPDLILYDGKQPPGLLAEKLTERVKQRLKTR